MTVLTFKYLSGGSETTVNFDDREVANLEIFTHQKTVLKRLQNRAPIVYYTSPGWREITIDFRPLDPDVSIDINILRQVTDIMTMLSYYGDGTLAEHIPVRIDPNIKFNYFAGYKDARRFIRVKLYEAISGEAAVEITLLPIGRH